jgi:L-fuculose-phosphate aldolase
MVSSLKQSAQVAQPWQILSELGRDFVERGLVVGTGGNLSMLLEDKKSFLITATGARLSHLTEESFAVVNLDGTFAQSGTQPSSEYRTHLASYISRSDITTCIHLHPQTSVLLAALDIDIKLITVDHIYYLRKITRIPWIPPGTQEIADAVAKELKDCNLLILENHGCLVVADNPELAASRTLNLEQAAELTLKSHLAGIEPRGIPDSWRRYLEEKGL